MARSLGAILATLFVSAVGSSAFAQSSVARGTRVAPPVSLRTAEVIERALPATVLVEVATASGKRMFGSGFVIDPSGVVVTNFHVIRGAASAKISLQNGDTYDRVIVRAVDPTRDIAILQVPGFNLPTIPLGDSDSVKQGDTVVVLGSPLGLNGTATSGIISAIRPLEGYRVFQTDAAANSGNSGGPMLNDRAEVVGILTFKLKESENLNFVVPINYARGLALGNDGLTFADLARAYPEVREAAPNSPAPQQPDASPTLETPPQAPKAEGGVMIYRPRQDGPGWGLRPSVYLDGKQIARSVYGSYFEVVLPAGRYSVRGNCQENELQVVVRPGEWQYVSVHMKGAWRPCGWLTAVPADRGRVQALSLDPLPADNAMDPRVRVR
jgi:hypothetical protein